MTDILSIISDLYNNVREKINSAINGVLSDINTVIQNVIANVAAWIAGLFNTIKTSITDTVNALVNKLEVVFNNLYNNFNDLVDSIKENLKEIYTNATTLITNLGRDIKDAINNAVTTLYTQLSNIFNKVVDSLKDAYKAVETTVKELYSSVKEYLSDVIAYVSVVANNVIEQAKVWIGDVYNNVSTILTNIIQNVKTFISSTITFAQNAYETVSSVIKKLIDNLKEVLSNLINSIANSFIGLVTFLNDNVVTPITTYFKENREYWDESNAAFNDIFRSALASNPELPPDVRAFFSSQRGIKGIISSIGVAMIVPMLATSILSSVYAPWLRKVEQAAEIQKRSALMTPDQSITLFRRGYISDAKLTNTMARNGYAPDDITAMVHLYDQVFPASDAVGLYRRGIIDYATLKNTLQAAGWLESQIPLILKASEYLPQPQDLIRFAVREAFNPNQVQMLGLDEEFPEAFATRAQQLGMSPDDARLYWRAHWELPSPSQGFEMYQRGIISYDELTSLLKALDYSPTWRDKLIKLAYSPLTRVDIRRMHALGILDRDGVYRSYLNIGYSPEDAEALTRFTEALNQEDEKQKALPDLNLTRSQIVDAYMNHMIDRETASELLFGLGYDENESEFILADADYQMKREELDMKIAILTNKYRNGLINIIELRDGLNKLDITSDEIEYILSKYEAIKESEAKLPSLSDLRNMLKYGIIDPQEFYETVIALGYSEYWAKRYLHLEGAKLED